MEAKRVRDLYCSRYPAKFIAEIEDEIEASQVSGAKFIEMWAEKCREVFPLNFVEQATTKLSFMEPGSFEGFDSMVLWAYYEYAGFSSSYADYVPPHQQKAGIQKLRKKLVEAGEIYQSLPNSTKQRYSLNSDINFQQLLGKMSQICDLIVTEIPGSDLEEKKTPIKMWMAHIGTYWLKHIPLPFALPQYSPKHGYYSSSPAFEIVVKLASNLPHPYTERTLFEEMKNFKNDGEHMLNW